LKLEIVQLIILERLADLVLFIVKFIFLQFT